MKNVDGAQGCGGIEPPSKRQNHCQPKHERKTIDEVLRVEMEQGTDCTEPAKYLCNCGETYCVGNAGTCGPQSADRHRKKVA